MNRDQVYAFYQKIEIHVEKEEDEWVMACCPLAEWTHRTGTDHNPSFGIHIEDNEMSFYNCFSCHHKGPISDLAKKLGRLRDDPVLIKYGMDLEKGHRVLAAEGAYRAWGEKVDTATKAKSTRPTVFIDARSAFKEYGSALGYPEAVAYLRRRGIGFSACFALRLRYDPQQSRILFPVWYHGNLVGFSGRSIRGDKYIRERNAVRKGSYPKIRDYKGLEKEVHLLSRPALETAYGSVITTTENTIGYGRRNERTIRTTYSQRRDKRFAIIVEGLFGFAHLTQIAPDIRTFGLMGSTLTEGKAQRLIELGYAIYWLTDNDNAGRDCLFGNKDPNTGKHRIKTGALYRIGYQLPQFIMSWPKLEIPVERKDGTIRYFKEDPDELTREELDHMIATAKVYVHKP